MRAINRDEGYQYVLTLSLSKGEHGRGVEPLPQWEGSNDNHAAVC